MAYNRGPWLESNLGHCGYVVCLLTIWLPDTLYWFLSTWQETFMWNSCFHMWNNDVKCLKTTCASMWLHLQVKYCFTCDEVKYIYLCFTCDVSHFTFEIYENHMCLYHVLKLQWKMCFICNKFTHAFFNLFKWQWRVIISSPGPVFIVVDICTNVDQMWVEMFVSCSQ